MEVNFFWFRRDLRIADNHGLYHALSSNLPVIPVFIFDDNILDSLKKDDARVEFLHQALEDLAKEIEKTGSSLLVLKGDPIKIWEDLTKKYTIRNVFFNHDLEPYPRDRDQKVAKILSAKGIEMKGYKDHLIYEASEIVKDDGKPYTVFTPYKNKWLFLLQQLMSEQIPAALQSWPSQNYIDNFCKTPKPFQLPTLEQIGFVSSGLAFPPKSVASSVISQYDKNRDYPAIPGTSKLGVHFRFGTISIRDKALKALKLNATYLNELIWRDFYAMILFHFPETTTRSFRPEYDNIEWRNDEKEFERWKQGKTGYPLVDAGMREIKATGYMHNRVRMVVASFLTKHLLIDWRWGEAYFAEMLLDYEQASNVGGWQWAAGCGTDAAPYFRIFNPTAQAEKFDPDELYIRKWVPEWKTASYPQPIVDHKLARERCLITYKRALSK